MANTHAEKQQGEEKIHGDALEDALSPRPGKKTTEQNNTNPEDVSRAGKDSRSQ